MSFIHIAGILNAFLNADRQYQVMLKHFYSKTNKMQQCIKFILFLNDTLHVSCGLSVHHQEFKTVHTATGICQTDTAVCLLASSSSISLVAVCTVLNSWWWTERPSETCRVSFKNKINFIHWCISWFYHRNNIMMHGPMNVKNVETLEVVFAAQRSRSSNYNAILWICEKNTWKREHGKIRRAPYECPQVQAIMSKEQVISIGASIKFCLLQEANTL